MNVAILQDAVFLDHADPFYDHPECPERLRAVDRALTEAGVFDQVVLRRSREATREELCAVHTTAYVEALSRRVPGQSGHLDPDTFYSTGSWRAALGAAGGAVDLVKDVLAGRDGVTFGLGLVRPPGHHAEADRAMGFCILNNAAIAAAAARAAGAGRVAVLDWDVHHGNGTQHAFLDRADVLYLSVHRFPFYPGTGAYSEIGRGDGAGFTVNVPLPGGRGDGDYALVFDEVFGPVLRQFRPDLVIVSAGYDAHATDPLGGMQVTDLGFRVMARKVRRVAEEVCRGRVVAVLEGGYEVETLGRTCRDLVGEMLAPRCGDDQEVPPRASRVTEQIVTEVKRAHAAYWSL